MEGKKNTYALVDKKVVGKKKEKEKNFFLKITHRCSSVSGWEGTICRIPSLFFVRSNFDFKCVLLRIRVLKEKYTILNKRGLRGLFFKRKILYRSKCGQSLKSYGKLELLRYLFIRYCYKKNYITLGYIYIVNYILV